MNPTLTPAWAEYDETNHTLRIDTLAAVKTTLQSLRKTLPKTMPFEDFHALYKTIYKQIMNSLGKGDTGITLVWSGVMDLVPLPAWAEYDPKNKEYGEVVPKVWVDTDTAFPAWIKAFKEKGLEAGMDLYSYHLFRRCSTRMLKLIHGYGLRNHNRKLTVKDSQPLPEGKGQAAAENDWRGYFNTLFPG